MKNFNAVFVQVLITILTGFAISIFTSLVLTGKIYPVTAGEGEKFVFISPVVIAFTVGTVIRLDFFYKSRKDKKDDTNYKW